MQRGIEKFDDAGWYVVRLIPAEDAVRPKTQIKATYPIDHLEANLSRYL